MKELLVKSVMGTRYYCQGIRVPGRMINKSVMTM